MPDMTFERGGIAWCEYSVSERAKHVRVEDDFRIGEARPISDLDGWVSEIVLLRRCIAAYLRAKGNGVIG
jgi:hypothetical protein